MSIDQFPVFVTLPRRSGGNVKLNIYQIAGIAEREGNYSRINMICGDCPIELDISAIEAEAMINKRIAHERAMIKVTS